MVSSDPSCKSDDLPAAHFRQSSAFVSRQNIAGEYTDTSGKTIKEMMHVKFWSRVTVFLIFLSDVCSSDAVVDG